MGSPPSRRVLGVVGALLAITAITAITACSGGDSGDRDNTVAIVAYSVPKPAYDDLQEAFVKTDEGEGTTFSASYGASGSQSKSVASGQEADYVAFSLEPDLARLVPEFVAKHWNSGAAKGMVSDSVVVFVVRKGNPKGIRTWSDLVKPDVKIVTPDPASSGSAKWNILAAYTQVVARGGSQAAATAYLTKFYQHTVSRPASGAEATTTFNAGTGDVLLSYENEAIAARQKGAEIDYVVPDATFLIENPAAVTTNASPRATKFLEFAHSAAGQKIFAANGFRPVLEGIDVGTVQGANDPTAPFPEIAKLSTVADLGGWATVDRKFFSEPDGIVTKIAKKAG